MTRFREICTIEGRIWSTREIDLPDGPYGLNWSHMFYDWNTGEVWGRRTLVPLDPMQGKVLWTTTDRDQVSMDMTEYRECYEGTVPPGLLCAKLVGLWRQAKKLDPTIPR